MQRSFLRLIIVTIFLAGLCTGSAQAASNPLPVPLPPLGAYSLR